MFVPLIIGMFVPLPTAKLKPQEWGRSGRQTFMDQNRFDALTRTYSTVRSRRAALGMLLAGTLSLFDLAETTATKSCPPCKKRKHGRCTRKKPNDTPCPGGTCQDGHCKLTVAEEQPPEEEPKPTCPAGECSRSRPCGPDCVCLDIGGGNRRCLAAGTCSGVGPCERGTCGPDCTCVNPGGAKTGCASVAGCPTGQCTSDTDCGSACICVGIGNAARCASVVP